MNVGIIGGADGPTAVLLSRPSPVTVIVCIAAVVVLLAVMGVLFAFCNKKGGIVRTVYIGTVLAANCLYLFISGAVLYVTATRRMFGLWVTQQVPSQDVIDEFFVYWYFAVIRLGCMVLLFFLLIGCMVILIGRKFWNETAKKVTAVPFYIFTAMAAVYDLISAVLIFCGAKADAVFAEAVLCIVLALLMIMADVMFARLSKETI